MGLLDVFKRKRPEPAEKVPEFVHEVGAERLPEWIEEHFRGGRDEALERAGKLVSGASSAAGDLEDSLRKLEKASFRGKDKTYAAANMAKDSFVNKALALIDGLRFPDPAEGHSSLKRLDADLKGVLRDLNSVSPKQLFLVSRYFSDESRQLTHSIRGLKERSGELESFLSSGAKALHLTEKSKKNAETIAGLLKSAERNREEERGIRAGIEELEKARRVARKRAEDMTRGKEWKEMEGLERSLEKARDSKAGLEAEANRILSEAKRPMKKLAHLAGDRGRFPENPFREIILAGGRERFTKKLEKARELAGKGSISLKPKEEEKLQNTLASMGSKIPEMLERFNKLAGEEDELKRKLSHFSDRSEKGRLEREAKEAGEALKQKWGELDAKMRERKETFRKAKELAEETEKLVLREGRRKLKIRIPEKLLNDLKE